ncbi:hypothetical protein KIN20_018096 [Parelaphostrongylus tenuis]|uniref:Uncharacterized protein n=1 Tax=Parelaphostrongylus tenuis TaxID=148309 RepID=A0AAD5N382_PARTN|nr:hypothetical protein KIN20_018096 [Parelaphostrongylus tenuis]
MDLLRRISVRHPSSAKGEDETSNEKIIKEFVHIENKVVVNNGNYLFIVLNYYSLVNSLRTDILDHFSESDVRRRERVNIKTSQKVK